MWPISWLWLAELRCKPVQTYGKSRVFESEIHSNFGNNVFKCILVHCEEMKRISFKKKQKKKN